MKRIILSLILLIINFPIYAQDSPFTFTSNTGDSYSILIEGATIDGEELESGNEIGVFTSSGLCVGAVVYSGSYPLGLTAWVDDSQTLEVVDGYVAGEEMAFKIWDKSENKEVEAEAIYTRGNGTFGDGAFANISTLTGITRKAEILIGTTSLEFGDVIVNSMSSLNLVIKNEGDTALVIADIVSSSNLFTVSKSEFEVSINDSDIVEVVFKPLDAGSFSGSLTIYSNDYDNPDTVVYVSGDGIPPSQAIELSQGWNWISFNVEPPDLSVENIFASTNNLEIVKNNEGQFYIPEVINSISTIDITQGYIVYLSAADSVVVTGTQVDISTSISLASGWNLISYIPTFSLTPEEAFSSISSNLAICKNGDGNFYIPGLFNNMPSLTAGEAYQLYLSSSTEFVYPSPILSKQAYKNRISANSLNKFKGGHFKYRSKTGDFYPVLIEVKENQLEIGDEVGVFINNGNGEICVGSSVFNGNSPLGISIWKDDAETDEIDGYREQDNITFKVWKTKENKEIPMTSTFSSGSDLINPSLPYLMVSDLITVKNEENYEDDYIITNYPNPFNPTTTIKFFLPNPAETTIEIYNVLGEKIKTLVNEYKLSGFYEVEWDAKNEYEENVASGVYLCRLKQGRDVLVKKLTVLR